MKMNDSTLNALAIKYGSDKWGKHFYTPHYEAYFSELKNSKIKLLEIGVGGYNDPKAGGASLRMWKEYFPNAEIHAIDIFDKTSHAEDRVFIYQGSQIDHDFLKTVVNSANGGFDIIIDDGSHINSHLIATFEILFPYLKENGIYVVEDLQTSYWKYYGGDSFNLQNKKTAMNYFKRLTDGLNYEEFDNPYYIPSSFDRNIVSIQFFHNMVFLRKGRNEEGSTEIVNNQFPTHNPGRAKIKYLLRFAISRIFGFCR